jgi:hypothetical protein
MHFRHNRLSQNGTPFGSRCTVGREMSQNGTPKMTFSVVASTGDPFRGARKGVKTNCYRTVTPVGVAKCADKTRWAAQQV